MSASAKKRRVTHGETIRAITKGSNIIEAHGLELKTILGSPYSGIDLAVKQGDVFAIRGRNGAGKTALLLTLAGRMRFTKGSLAVCGHALPREARAVQQRVGLGLFEGINDLPETQLARDAVGAEFELYERTLSKQDVADYLEEWKLADVSDKRVRELTRNELVHLTTALAWAGHPDIIAVDDIESQLTKDQSSAMMDDLLSLAHKRNVTVLVGVLERDLAAQADDALYL